ncbi:MAG: hypothetical protein P9X24_20005 [Candidatus Hatepunaea meridiana]|nr:hypothetical protein [Candidatus Hatepunaea meridiana]
MIIAVTTWNNRISPVFDVAQNLLVINSDKGVEIDRYRVSLAGLSPPLKIDALKRNNIEMVLCGAVSEAFLGFLTTSGIRIEPWICGNTDEVIQAALQNRLSEPCYRMPGCCHFRGNGMQHRHGRIHNR